MRRRGGSKTAELLVVPDYRLDPPDDCGWECHSCRKAHDCPDVLACVTCELEEQGLCPVAWTEQAAKCDPAENALDAQAEQFYLRHPYA